MTYLKLPLDLKEVMFAVKTVQDLEKISLKNKLNDQQLWWTSYVIGLILLAETNIVDFVKTLQEKLELKEEPTRQLARDINQEIFLPVKESLKKIHQVPEWPREKETTPDQPVNNEPQLNGNIVDLKNEN